MPISQQDRTRRGSGARAVLRGVCAHVAGVAEWLAAGACNGGVSAPAARQRIQRLLAQVSSAWERHGGRKGEWTARTRKHVAWLRFFDEDAHVAEYVAALERAVRVCTPTAAAPRWPRPLRVHFLPTQSMYRVRSAGESTRILLPTPMITFSDAGFARLARAMFERRSRGDSQALHAMMLADPYQRVRKQLERLGGIAEQVRGETHDLSKSFQRVNAAYFAGAMPRPQLTWSRTHSTSRFGYYKYASDTISISRALDRPSVPVFVVDHVMHHELLHKKYGLRWHKGRGHAHTHEFREEECRFSRFLEADLFLRRLAARGGP